MNPFWIFLIVIAAIAVDEFIGYIVVNYVFKHIDVATPLGIRNDTGWPWFCCFLLYTVLVICFLPIYIVVLFLLFVDWVRWL